MLVEIPKWIEVATCRLIYALRRKLLIVRPATFFVNQASWTCWTVGFNINPFSSENRAANQVTVASDVHRKTFSRMIQMSFRLPQHQQRFWYRVLHTHKQTNRFIFAKLPHEKMTSHSRELKKRNRVGGGKKKREVCAWMLHICAFLSLTKVSFFFRLITQFV